MHAYALQMLYKHAKIIFNFIESLTILEKIQGSNQPMIYDFEGFDVLKPKKIDFYLKSVGVAFLLFGQLIQSTNVFAIPRFMTASNFLANSIAQEVISMAKSQEKIPILFLSAEWCPSCKWLKLKIEQDKELKMILEKDFYLEIVDADSGKGKLISEQYEVPWLPSLIFLDSDGKEFYRLGGDGNLSIDDTDTLKYELYLIKYNALKKLDRKI